MAQIKFANNVSTQLIKPVAADDSTIEVRSLSQGLVWPDISTAGDYFLIVIDDASASTWEILKCTEVEINDTTTVLTVERGLEGTTPSAFSAGSVVENRLTAGTLNMFSEEFPTVVEIDRGGTGATTAEEARTNLEVPSKTEVDSDINALDTKLTSAINTKASTYHAASNTTYGLGTDTLYGHVKSDGSTTQISNGSVVVKDISLNTDNTDLASERGIFNSKDKGSIDYNTLLAQGMYTAYSAGATNGPGGARRIIVLSDNPNDSDTVQVAVTNQPEDKRSLSLDVRASHPTNGWTDWKKFISETDIATSSTAGIVKPNDGLDITSDGTLSVDDTVVRTSGDETISGIKSFSNGPIVTNNNVNRYILQNLAFGNKRSDKPSTNAFSRLDIYNGGGLNNLPNREGKFEYAKNSNGNCRIYMQANNPGNDSTEEGAVILVGWTTSDDSFRPYTSAPTPPATSNGTEIATTRWVRNYAPTATGTTKPRSLADRFGDIINVKDFGAKGDGVTDDTAAFEAAAATGKTVFVPAASYYLRTTVTGSFFAVSEVVLTGAHCTIERIDEGGVKAKLALLAQKLSCVDTSLDITDFPNRSTHTVQSLCYDSNRNRFYVGMNTSDVNNAQIVTMSSIDEYLLGSSHAVPAGHINDMTYDAQNDRVIIAPGTELAGQLLVMNPDSYEVSAVTVASSGVWEVSIDDRTGWIYFVTGGKLCRCNEDFVVDEDFSITFPSATSLPSKSAVNQGSFFVDGCFVLIRNIKMDTHWARNEFVIVDTTTGIFMVSSFTVPSWEEVEAVDIANGVLEILANTDTRKGVASHKISMDAFADKPFVRFLSNVDLDSIRYPGEYRIGSAATFDTITNTPPYAYKGGALVLVYTAGTDYTVQEYRGGNQEWFYRTCGASDAWSSWRKITGFYGRWVDGGFDANECTAAGMYMTTSKLTNIPEGSNGFIINFEAQQRTNYEKIVKQFFIRQGTTGVSEHVIYLRQLQYNKSSESWTYGDWVKIITERDTFPNNFAPKTDNIYTLGTSARRWSQLYAATTEIGTSDEREKQTIQPYPDDILNAWGDVEFRQFLFKDAVAKKGDAARIHAGVIAQQVIEAFSKHNLDATKYGLLCYDEWDDEYEDVEVIDSPAVLDENGNEITPAKKHTEQKLITKAGSRYGIRYSEALCLEAAYQRRRADMLEQRIAAIEEKLK